MERTYSLFQVQISTVKRETLPSKMIYCGLPLEFGQKEQSYNDYSEKLGCWILGKMYLFWRITLRQTSSSRTRGIKKTTRKVEKMFESHDRLCRFETCILGVSSVEDNGVTKCREVVSHGSVESDFALLD